MELANWTNPDFRAEAYRVFAAHARDPYYPKPLTVPELLAQVGRLRGHELTALVPQLGGGGKLQSQFMNYIRQCSCACWPSWNAAWKDFAVFMEFDKPAMVPEPEPDGTPYQFDGIWR